MAYLKVFDIVPHEVTQLLPEIQSCGRHLRESEVEQSVEREVGEEASSGAQNALRSASRKFYFYISPQLTLETNAIAKRCTYISTLISMESESSKCEYVKCHISTFFPRHYVDLNIGPWHTARIKIIPKLEGILELVLYPIWVI